MKIDFEYNDNGFKEKFEFSTGSSNSPQYDDLPDGCFGFIGILGQILLEYVSHAWH